MEDLQSQFEDFDNEVSVSAGNRENDQPTMLGDLLTMSWNIRKVKLDRLFNHWLGPKRYAGGVCGCTREVDRRA